MTRLQRLLSPVQLDRLAARRAGLGAEGAGAAERDWRELGGLLRAELRDGAAPSSRSVQALARRAWAYIEDFTGGDQAIHDALDHLRRQEPPDDLAGWDAELLDFLDDALSVLRTAEARGRVSASDLSSALTVPVPALYLCQRWGRSL